ncbi:hypothetical protein JCGZ_04096 [Jatropha curcas]|uniref:Peptidase A1 domain-containing protein n=1 Tax=Jatropha curcas TaxID=180498 RepID=A0A067KUX8_JATCU|nr:aspartic proteinase CDR1 [Jatropha curcas]KDP38743.1 hypothetical protein JCGZ_04096 [Jatropha curcas]
MAIACGLFSLLLLILALSAKTIEAYTFRPKRSVTKLIHHDSILSPYYNPNDTIADRTERTMKASATWMAYLYAQIARNKCRNDLQLNLVPSAFEPLFMVSFSIGQPPVPQLAIMDTGSSLLWVQCAPCKRCLQQTGSLLDPSKSSTYATLSCRDTVCPDAPGSKCNWLNQCMYNQTYVGSLPSVGVLATEQIIIHNSDGSTNAVPYVVFGCSHENGNYRDRRFTGIFGLGNGITSFVTQMGSKFSYCIGNVADSHYKYNQLVIGDGANIEGSSTPLEVVAGHYYVTLEGISVGEKRLNIDSTAFRSKRKGQAVIIDSGTALTWLAKNLYRALGDEVQSLLDRVLVPFWRESFLCYKGRVDQDLTGFPVVTFHFAGGADLELDSESMFYQATPDVLCMAMRQASTYSNNFTDFSVVGLMAQQYHNMGYDLDKHELFFQRIDCELLVD